MTGKVPAQESLLLSHQKPGWQLLVTAYFVTSQGRKLPPQDDLACRRQNAYFSFTHGERKPHARASKLTEETSGFLRRTGFNRNAFSERLPTTLHSRREIYGSML